MSSSLSDGESILLCIADAKVERRKWAMHGVNYKTELFGEYHPFIVIWEGTQEDFSNAQGYLTKFLTALLRKVEFN